MKRLAKEIKRQTEKWLDERWKIMNMEEAGLQDISYYKGAIAACEWLGYEWKRDIEGHHLLTKL